MNICISSFRKICLYIRCLYCQNSSKILTKAKNILYILWTHEMFGNGHAVLTNEYTIYTDNGYKKKL